VRLHAVLKKPIIVSIKALLNVSPTLPMDGPMASSARCSVNRIESEPSTCLKRRLADHVWRQMMLAVPTTRETVPGTVSWCPIGHGGSAASTTEVSDTAPPSASICSKMPSKAPEVVPAGLTRENLTGSRRHDHQPLCRRHDAVRHSSARSAMQW
jgi:hypothetical protein